MSKSVGPFTAIIQAGAPGFILSADSIYSAIVESQDSPSSWQIDVPSETQAVERLVERHPDLLGPGLYIWQRICQAKRRYPANYSTAIPALRRSIAEAIRASLQTDLVPLARKSDRDFSRVAVVLPWLPGGINNNIARVAAGYVAGLRQMPGVQEVFAIVTNESVSDCIRSEFLRPPANVFETDHARILVESGVPSDALVYMHVPCDSKVNSAHLISLIRELRPTACLFPNFELTAQYAHALNLVSRTTFLQTSLRNRPSLDYDEYLYLGGERQIDSSHQHPDRWRFHTFGYSSFAQSDSPKHWRRDLGLEEDVPLIVVAGNRLEFEVTEDFLHLIWRATKVVPDLHFVLAGVKDEVEMRRRAQLAGLSPGQSSYIPYVADLGDLLEACDLYVNPRRTGGAVSMALSVQAGTPVISFSGSDAENFLLDDLVAETDEEFLETLLLFLRDREEYAAAMRRQVNHFNLHHTVDAAARDYITCGGGTRTT